jgi:hypothetical protein
VIVREGRRVISWSLPNSLLQYLAVWQKNAHVGMTCVPTVCRVFYAIKCINHSTSIYLAISFLFLDTRVARSFHRDQVRGHIGYSGGAWWCTPMNITLITEDIEVPDFFASQFRMKSSFLSCWTQFQGHNAWAQMAPSQPYTLRVPYPCLDEEEIAFPCFRFVVPRLVGIVFQALTLSPKRCSSLFPADTARPLVVGSRASTPCFHRYTCCHYDLHLG